MHSGKREEEGKESGLFDSRCAACGACVCVCVCIQVCAAVMHEFFAVRVHGGTQVQKIPLLLCVYKKVCADVCGLVWM